MYILVEWIKIPLMQLHHAKHVAIQTDVVVLGTNPENADLDNPRGNVYGFCGYLVAEAADGSRWIFNRRHSDYSEAAVLDRLATFSALVQARLDGGGTLDPRFWEPARPGYGSDAYANGGWSQLDYMQERMDEEFA